MSETTASRDRKRGAPRLHPIERRWLLRLGVVLAIGLVLGAAAGIVAVNTLEPGQPVQPDSLQSVIDSVQQGIGPAPARRGASGAADGASAQSADDQRVDTARAESVVPDLVGADEGAARNALATLGLEVSGVEFRASASPAGTVLATTPSAGARIARGSTVALVLSDGRSTDTLRTP